MGVVGRVESVWRYPLKSMGGEKLESAFVGFAGLYGDRIFAFHNSAAVAGFPFLTGREHAAMLLHRPRFRHRDKAISPPNLAAAQHLAPGRNAALRQPGRSGGRRRDSRRPYVRVGEFRVA